MPLESTAQYISRIMAEKNLSGYDIERRTRKRITQSYANRIKLGEVKNPSPEKLKALAVGLDVPEQELFDVVLGVKIKKDAQLETEIMHYIRELSPTRQHDLLEITKALYKREQTKIVLAPSIGETTEGRAAKRKRA